MIKITINLKLYSSSTPIGHLLAEVSKNMHSETGMSQIKPDINKLNHQNIGLSSKMKNKDERPWKDQLPDGSIF